MGRPKGSTNKQEKPQKIDWEKLAKQLQQALAKEIKDNDVLNNRVTNLTADNLKLIGIIGYLEKRLGYN